MSVCERKRVLVRYIILLLLLLLRYVTWSYEIKPIITTIKGKDADEKSSEFFRFLIFQVLNKLPVCLLPQTMASNNRSVKTIRKKLAEKHASYTYFHQYSYIVTTWTIPRHESYYIIYITVRIYITYWIWTFFFFSFTTRIYLIVYLYYLRNIYPLPKIYLNFTYY